MNSLIDMWKANQVGIIFLLGAYTIAVPAESRANATVVVREGAGHVKAGPLPLTGRTTEIPGVHFGWKCSVEVRDSTSKEIQCVRGSRELIVSTVFCVGTKNAGILTLGRGPKFIHLEVNCD